jgi:uncharacterized membrane protein
MKNVPVLTIIQNGFIAAIYVVLTLTLSPIAFEMIQFRLSELVLLIVFYRKDWSVGLMVGTFIANYLGPFGLSDAMVGTMATGLSLLAMTTTHRLWLASLYPTVINGLLIGLLLSLVNETPFWINVSWVALGQFVVLTMIGLPLMNLLLRHPYFKKWLVSTE